MKALAQRLTLIEGHLPDEPAPDRTGWLASLTEAELDWLEASLDRSEAELLASTDPTDRAMLAEVYGAKLERHLGDRP